MTSTPRLRAKKVKVTGSMSPTWISDILKEGGVSKVVQAQGKKVFNSSEAKALAMDGSSKKGNFGSKVLKGAWGTTFVFWPITQTAANAKSQVKAALLSAGLIVNPKKRGL